MRSFKSGLFTFTIAGIVGMAAVIGCSAEGASDVISDQSGTEPEDTTGGNQLPPSNPDDDTDPPKTDASTKKDASTKTDAAKDAGPPPPNPGDACTTVDKV